MVLGIMQPYLFPYLGYFDLINYSDRWIVFDTVQYIRHGWINRNRILHPTEGWQYIIAPLRKHPRETLIQDVLINDDTPWREKIIGQLQHYKKRAPYFRETLRLVDACLGVAETSIVRLNTHTLATITGHLRIPFDCQVFSDMALGLSDIAGPGDWALAIATRLGASEYVNPPGGEAIFESQRFTDRGIQLTIRNIPPMEYACPGYTFSPNLSVLDALMWNPPEAVRAYLDAQLTISS